jgi:site-specific DNA-methyltransferase (adenine-specific)
MGSYPNPRNGILKIDYEFILIFKKQGDAPKPSQAQKERSALSKEEWNTCFAGHWNFAGAKQDGHLAMFPEELPARLIKMFSFSEETVLDTFLGSGTTSLAARNLRRNSVGYEINPQFIEIVKQKLNVCQNDLARTEYEFLSDEAETVNTKEQVANLPYIFRDPHTLNTKIDQKKLQFGSKIDQNSGEREEYFSVKEVISPELLKLNNNLTVRLIGIKEDAATRAEAVSFLAEKTKRQKVFMKFDTRKYDENNNLLCYLYLRNKTFINAHLLKHGLAHVSADDDFKYKKKFIKIIENLNG